MMTREPDNPHFSQYPTDSGSEGFRGGTLVLTLNSGSEEELTRSIQSLQEQTWSQWILFVGGSEESDPRLPKEIELDKRICFQAFDALMLEDEPTFAAGWVEAGIRWKPTELEECVWTLISGSSIGWIDTGGLLLVRPSIISKLAPNLNRLDEATFKQGVESVGSGLGYKGHSRRDCPKRFLDPVLLEGLDVENNALALAEFPNELVVNNSLKPWAKRLIMIAPAMHLGGSDRFNLNLIDQMRALGWAVTVAITDKGNHAWRDAFEGCADEVFVLPEFVSSIWLPKSIEYLVSSRNPAAVIIAGSEKAYWHLPYIRSCFPELPIVDYSHIEEAYWKHGGIPRYAGRSSDLLNLNLVSSEHLKAYLLKRFMLEENSVEVITTNIDADYWVPDAERRMKVRKDIGVSEEKCVVLFAGRICHQKQPHVLAKTIQLVAQESSVVEFWIAGVGEDKAWLEKFIDKEGLQDKVRFLGSIPPEEILFYMQAADVFFLPSLWEGIALALYEAMAVGLVVVSSDVGGQKELVVEGTGYLISMNPDGPDAEASKYAGVLLQLIQEPEMRQKVARAARRRICEHYPFSDLGDRMEFALNRAVELKPSAAVDRSLAYELSIRAIEYFRLSELLQEKESSYQEWFSKLQEKASWLQSERDALEGELSSLQSHVDSFKKQCDQLSEAKQWLESQCLSMQSFIQEQREAHEKEKTAFQGHIEQLQSYIDELESGRDWLVQQIEAVEAYNAELKTGNAWQIQQIEGVEAYNTELKAWNTELKAGNAWQAKQLLELGSHVEDLKNGIEFHKNQSECRAEEVQRLEAELYHQKNWWKVWRRLSKERES